MSPVSLGVMSLLLRRIKLLLLIKITPVLGTPTPILGLKVKRDDVMFSLVFQIGPQVIPMESSERAFR